MAYLVQRNFKNKFYDFQLSKCEYIPDGVTIDDAFGTDSNASYWTESITIRINKEPVIVPDLPFMRVYPLKQGKPIKGYGMYWFYGSWMTKQEIIDILIKQHNNQ